MRKMKTGPLIMLILLSLLVGCSDESMDKMSLIKSDIAVGKKLEEMLKNDLNNAINVVPESIDHKGGLEKTDLRMNGFLV